MIVAVNSVSVPQCRVIADVNSVSVPSVDWLLQERQVDPEQVLLNLGFGGGVPTTTNMYARIPERFLQTQEPEAPQDEDGTQEGAPAEGTPRRNPSRGQCMIPALGRSCHCVDSEYYTYILNRVPAYFFKEKAPSEHSSSCSASSDSEELLLPPVAVPVARPAGKRTAGADGAGAGAVPGSSHAGFNVRPNPRTPVSDNGKKAPDSVLPDSHHAGYVGTCERDDGRAGGSPAEFSVEFRPPEEDNISSSSESASAADDLDYPYGFTLSPNESLV